ncbi:hypothetical protein CBS9595_002995 [Malassezia furfur]|nr:hypothetical protein CBS9595_002995 [Malassezia furfur]
MDAFSSGSELSSAEEGSGDERAPRAGAPTAAAPASQASSADTPARERDTPRRKRSDARERTTTPVVPQPKRARIATDDDAAYEEEPDTSRTSDAPTRAPKKPTKPAAPRPAQPAPRVVPPVSDEPVNVETRPRTAPKPAASEPAFGRNMSGWDQLFGPIAQSPAPKVEARAKDATPEQRAAAAEAAAKEREAEVRERAARERAAREREQREKQAQERAAREAAAREAARQQRMEKRPTSVTQAELDEHRVRLRAAINTTRHLDLLAGCRLMTAFEEDMGAERRHLRASRFGAGLHHLGGVPKGDRKEGGAPPAAAAAAASPAVADATKHTESA